MSRTIKPLLGNDMKLKNRKKTKEPLGLLEKWRKETNAPVLTTCNPDYEKPIK